MEKIVYLTDNQAKALLDDISEIRQLEQQMATILEVKKAASNRHASTIIQDAGIEDSGGMSWDVRVVGGKKALVLSQTGPVGIPASEQETAKKAALGGK